MYYLSYLWKPREIFCQITRSTFMIVVNWRGDNHFKLKIAAEKVSCSLNNQNFVMDKETTRRDIRFSRKNRKCLVRGFFAGRIVTSSTPLKVSSRLRCRKYQGDGYDVDDFDSQEESLDPEMSLNKKRQSQSINPQPRSLEKNQILYTPSLEKKSNTLLILWCYMITKYVLNKTEEL